MGWVQQVVGNTKVELGKEVIYIWSHILPMVSRSSRIYNELQNYSTIRLEKSEARSLDLLSEMIVKSGKESIAYFKRN